MRFSFIPASQYADRDFELGCDLINAPMDALPGFKLGPIDAEVLQRNQTTRCARNRTLNIPVATRPPCCKLVAGLAGLPPARPPDRNKKTSFGGLPCQLPRAASRSIAARFC